MSTTCLRVGGLMEKERAVGKGKRNMGKIKFLQLNAQHAKQAQHEINRWIDRQKDNEYVVLVQEPYLYKNKPAIQPLSAKNTILNTLIIELQYIPVETVMPGL